MGPRAMCLKSKVTATGDIHPLCLRRFVLCDVLVPGICIHIPDRDFCDVLRWTVWPSYPRYRALGS
eukprot:991122-Pyramimonas_sp.AAC.1